MSYYGGQATKIKFSNTPLPTGAGDRVLFDTSLAYTGKSQFRAGGIRKFVFDIRASQAGDIRVEKSNDRFVNNNITVSTTAMIVGTNQGEFLVELYDDFRIVWVNGGVDQTSWEVDIALSDDRAAS